MKYEDMYTTSNFLNDRMSSGNYEVIYEMDNLFGINKIASRLSDTNDIEFYKQNWMIIVIDELVKVQQSIDDNNINKNILRRMMKIILMIMSLLIYMHNVSNINKC